jgi:probable blue pigment (indigoidine) exporter
MISPTKRLESVVFLRRDSGTLALSQAGIDSTNFRKSPSTDGSCIPLIEAMPTTTTKLSGIQARPRSIEVLSHPETPNDFSPARTAKVSPTEASARSETSAQGTPQTDEPGKSDLLAVVFLGVIWGSAFPVIHFGLVAGAPPLFFASARAALTAGVIVPIAILARAPRPSAVSLLSPGVFGGLFMIGGYGGLLYLGEVTTSGGLAAILTASAPLASAVFGLALLPAERLGRWGVGGLLIGFGGVGVLVLPQLDNPFSSGFEGPALVVAAVLTFSLGSVLLRKTAVAPPGLWTLAIQFSVAAVLLAALAPALGETAGLGRSPSVYLSLLLLVLFPGTLGYTLYFRIHHRSGPTRANLVGYINPVTGVVVGLLIFGESVTKLEVGGMCIIALGLFLFQRNPSHTAPSLNTSGGKERGPGPTST